MRLATMISFVLLCCASSVAYSQEMREMQPRLRGSEPIPQIELPPPDTGMKIVKCRIGPDEVTIEGQGAHMLATGGAGADRVYSGGKMWGYVSRQRDDLNCPAILTRQTGGGGYGSALPPRFCISAGGMVSELFHRTRVGNCEICNTAGNCYALQIP